MGLVGIVFGRVIPFVVVVVAVFVGWLMYSPIAPGSGVPKFGFVFATIAPLLDGRLPPLWVGHGKMVGTPEVPPGLVPAPRPDGELFATLPGGHAMPMSGLGMCCRYSAYDDELVRRTVLWYLLKGGRHIDGAHVYLNHRAIGRGIRDAIDRGIPREEIFLTTKVFPSHFGYEDTLALGSKFLEETGLDYIDLVLMHAPSMPLTRSACAASGKTDTDCRKETWRALSELRANGVIRNAGVSNFRVPHLEEISEGVEGGAAPIAVNQFQFNPFVPQPQHDIFDYCQQHNITVTGYYSLGGSLEREKTQAVGVLQRLSEKHGVSIPRLLLRWSVQKGAAVIPGTGNPNHMEDNLGVYSFELSPEDMADLDGLKNTDEASQFTYIDLDIF